MNGVLISVFGAFVMTLSLRTEIPPDSQTTEDDETFKDLRFYVEEHYFQISRFIGFLRL